jgi:hypothetical protein
MVTEDRGKRTQWFYETRGGDPIRVLDRVDYSGGGTGVLRIASMDEAKRRLLKTIGAEGEERV